MEWIANPLYITLLACKLNDLNTLNATRTRIAKYILSKHPHLPEESIASIIKHEIEDITKAVESGMIGRISFEDRRPYMDKLIRAEVYRVISARPL